MEEQKRRRERKSAAYWLSKSSILYPICILYVMYHDLAGYIAHMTGLSYRRRIDPPKKEETDEGKAEK